MEKEFNYEVALQFCSNGVAHALADMSISLAILIGIPFIMLLAIGFIIGLVVGSKNEQENK